MSLSISPICDIIEQKQRLSLYNVPPIRLGLVSTPYPQFSQFQLNMRRKVEILKHTNVQQNTKTNNKTKNENYAYLVKNNNIVLNPVKQLKLQNCIITNKLKPTSTTSCDIPGTPMTIFYDPTVQLYNFKENRVYAFLDEINTSTFDFYTKNIIQYLEELFFSTTPDNIFLSSHTYISTVGSLIIGKKLNVNKYKFSLSIPIAFWFYGSLNSGYDIDGNYISKPAIIPNEELSFSITKIALNVFYNNKVVQPLTPAILDYSTIINCSLNLNTLQSYKQFYGIQYLGMLNITELELETPPNTIYDMTLEFNYTYNKELANKLDFIQTGIYVNLPEATSPDYLFRCSLNSVSPNDFSKGNFVYN